MQRRAYRVLSVKFLGTLSLACSCMMSCKNLSDDPMAHNWQAMAGEPAANSPILQQAAESQCAWVVSRDAKDAHIKIEGAASLTHQQGREIRLQVETGILVGTNNGEYSGSLSLTDPTGTFTKRILAENVIRLLPVKSGVLVFTGLLHLDADKGSVWLYSRTSNNDWSIKKLFELDGYPRAVYSGDEDVLAVTGHSVFRVDQSLNLTKVASLPFAQTLPNSLAEDARGRVYIGMNAFVLRLVPTTTGYTHEWFTKSGCLP